MNTLQALGTCVSISLVTSSIILAAIMRPLDTFMGSLCPDRESGGFWVRFTMVMLFLSPLLFTVSFGVPRDAGCFLPDVGQIIQRAVTATVLGAFFAMLGMGIWVSSLARRAPASSQDAYKAAEL